MGLLENITENFGAQETSVSKMPASRATKMLQLLPCKEKVVRVLKEHDRVARIHFCIWFIQAARDGKTDTQLVLFCDEARD
jgi:hypothetical protein